MTSFYKKASNLYVPNSIAPFKLSRSKMELFSGCRRCFYLDRRIGVARPPGFPFNLNSCVDALFKTEFDSYRSNKKKHPIMPDGLIPFEHIQMDVWRNNFKGVQFHHKESNFLLTGAVDDVWVDKDGVLYVVDYKSTSKKDRIVKLDQAWHDGYKRQMEFYQWLLRMNGFEVANKGYFVYANGDKEQPKFDNKMVFETTLVPHDGADDWVEGVLMEMKTCLDSDDIPEPNMGCDYCNYVAMCREVGV